jgi:predicted phage terminase large subunit-like protein
MYFRRHWCEIVDAAPHGCKWVRGWDFAGTEKRDDNKPDWTAGAKIGLHPDGRVFVSDLVAYQLSPGGVERLVRGTAEHDGREVEIDIPQDPGQAGKAQVAAYAKLLMGYRMHSSPESGDKVTRFGPFSSQAEAGNVYIVQGPWNERLITDLENFPESGKDSADAVSRAFNRLWSAKNKTKVTW